MINKKVSIEIAIGVIALVAFLFGGVFWIQNKKDSQQTLMQQPNPNTNETLTSSSPSNIDTDNIKERNFQVERPKMDNIISPENNEPIITDLKFDNLFCKKTYDGKYYITRKDKIVAELTDTSPEVAPGCELEKVGEKNIYVGLVWEGRDTRGPDVLYKIAKDSYKTTKVFDFFTSKDGFAGYLRDISNNEKMYILVSYGGDRFNNIDIYDMDGQKKYEFIGKKKGVILNALFSPDDTKIAYTYNAILESNETSLEYSGNESGVYIIDLETGSQKKVTDGKSDSADVVPVSLSGWKNNNEVDLSFNK